MSERAWGTVREDYSDDRTQGATSRMTTRGPGSTSTRRPPTRGCAGATTTTRTGSSRSSPWLRSPTTWRPGSSGSSSRPGDGGRCSARRAPELHRAVRDRSPDLRARPAVPHARPAQPLRRRRDALRDRAAAPGRSARRLARGGARRVAARRGSRSRRPASAVRRAEPARDVRGDGRRRGLPPPDRTGAGRGAQVLPLVVAVVVFVHSIRSVPRGLLLVLAGWLALAAVFALVGRPRAHTA